MTTIVFQDLEICLSEGYILRDYSYREILAIEKELKKQRPDLKIVYTSSGLGFVQKDLSQSAAIVPTHK